MPITSPFAERAASRLTAPSLFIAALLAGCGPLSTLMPARLDDKQQLSIDSAWNTALTPIDRADHQALLDILVTSYAWELGVDRIAFRSEKDFAGGVVIMELRYDRSRPEDDRFTVTVLGADARTLRQESYARAEVESTYHDLCSEFDALKERKQTGGLSPSESNRLSALAARRQFAARAFPVDLTPNMEVSPHHELGRP